MRQRPHRDQGASLLMVLVFMALVSVLTLALLSFVDASYQTSSAVRESRQQVYAADAALELAIQRVEADASGTLGTACDLTVRGLESKHARVRCTQDSVESGTSRYPANAILTRSTSGSSLNIEGQHPLTIDGPVYSWGGVSVNNANNSKISAIGSLTAEGDGHCSNDTRVSGSPKTCGSPQASRSARGGALPLWSPEPSTGSPGAPPACPATSTVAIFSPGIYGTDPSSLADGCAGRRTLYFNPGVYYFTTTFTTKGYDVVAGAAAGSWLSAGTSPPNDGTACGASSVSTQFVFGRGAGLTIGSNSADTSFSICAGESSRPQTQPPIAIWGASEGAGLAVPAEFGSCPSPPRGCTLPAGDISAHQKANVFVTGTLFAPSSAANLWMKVKQESYYDGGLVLFTATVRVSASTTQTKSPFQIERCVGTCVASRTILLQAFDGDSGPLRSRALVRFVGPLGVLPTSSEVLSWSVVR